MDTSEQLQRYLEGELDAAGRAAFEQQMEQDADLAERVRLHQRLDLALGNRKEMEVESLLQGMMEEALPDEESAPGGSTMRDGRDGKPEGRSRRMRNRILVAAAVAAIITVIGFFVVPKKEVVPLPKLYAAYYVPYDASGELRTDGTVPQDMLDIALETYGKRKYHTSGVYFQLILDSFPNHSRSMFFLGICQLELNDHALARMNFEAVLADGNNLYLNQASWYLAMSCLQLKDKACARKQLESLKMSKNKYQEGAEKVLNAME